MRVRNAHELSLVLLLASKREAAPHLLRWRTVHEQIGRGRPGGRVDDIEFLEALRLDHLLLPRNRDAARVELRVESVVRRVQRHALHRRELFNVEHVLGIHGVWLNIRT